MTEPVFRIGAEFEVRTDLGCLRRMNGEEVPLRPKTFQTLLYLVRNRHRLVTKEELTVQLWSDTAVTDDALVQCIVELRKALGDAAKEPRYVRTVPKMGYRFLGEVEEIHSSAAPVLPQPIERPSVRLWQAVGAAAIIVVLVVAVLVRSRTSSPDAAALDPATGRPGVAVMFFDNQSRTAEIDWMREGLAEMLITGLSRSERLNVLGRKQLLTLMGRVGRASADEMTLNMALDIARRSNATYVVLGSFAQMGQRTRIDVHVEDLAAKRIASETLTVDRPDDVLTQVDLLAWKLARHLNVRFEEPKIVPAAGLTTNLDAYRYYSLGLSKAISYHNKEAIDLFQRALELDPKFVLARARIGYVYAVTWSQPELAKPYLDEAYRSADQLRESDRLLIQAWHAIANFDYPAAIAPLERLITLYPYEVEAYDRLARLLGGERRHPEAIEVVKRGLLVDPESGDLHNTLGNLYSDTGRPADAIATHQRFVALAPEEPNSHDSLGLSYQAAGRYDDAEAEYQRALTLKPDFEVALIHLANVYVQTGRYRAATLAYERYLKSAPSLTERLRGYQCLSVLYMRRGNLKVAEQFASMADDQERRHYGHDFPAWSRLLLDTERHASHEALPSLSVLSRGSNRGVRSSDRMERLVLGWSNLRQGRTAEAIEHFRMLLQANPMSWSIDSFDDALANAYLELGRLDEAIAEYERVLRANPRYPRTHYYLGLAQERKGDPASARRAFEQFLVVWSAADTDVPEIIDAKARLARLTH